MLIRLRLEVAAFARRVERKFDLAAKQEELHAIQQREASLHEFYCLLKQQENFREMLPEVVLQQFTNSTDSQFGLGELALPMGANINPMPIFRFKTLLAQLEKATSVEDVRRIFARFHERSLFCGANHVREIFIQLGRRDLRQEVWRLCAPYIPEKESIAHIVEILPMDEQASIKKAYWFDT